MADPELLALPAVNRSVRSFLLAFGAAVFAFLLRSAIVQHAARSSDQAAIDIATNGAPSIEHITEARASMREMLVEVEELIGAARVGHAVDRTLIDRERGHFDDEVRAYLRLPAYPGEHEQWASVSIDRAEFDRALDRLIVRLQRDPTYDATADEQQLHGIADHVSATIISLTQLNARFINADADTIARARRSTLHIAWMLDALCVLLALLAAATAVRSAFTYERLIDRHRRAAERRADELEQFAGRVAHDIRSPLDTVSLALETTRTLANGDERIGSTLARGRRGLDRVVRTVEALLDFARSGAHPARDERADVRTVLDDVLEDVLREAASAGVAVSVEPFAATPVACGAGALASVLANLLRNAVKYVGHGAVTVCVSPRDGCVRIEVRDTGPGVPPGLRDSIFDPYVRAEGLTQPGLGLGLATVRRVCESHGGRVGYTAPAGGGSVFWFELPRATDAGVPAA